MPTIWYSPTTTIWYSPMTSSATATVTTATNATSATTLWSLQGTQIWPHQYGTPTPTAAPSPSEVERSRQVAAATARARDLLLSFLTPPERTEFETHERITLKGKSGARYRIRRGTMGNVDVLPPARDDARDVPAYRLCFHPRDHSLPVFDVMLAQYLHLKDDDRAVERIANRHRY